MNKTKAMELTRRGDSDVFLADRALVDLARALSGDASGSVRKAIEALLDEPKRFADQTSPHLSTLQPPYS